MSWIRMAIAGVAFVGVASVAGAQGPPAGGSPPPDKAQGAQGAQGADRRGSQEERDTRMAKRMFAGIELTPAQEEQRKKILEKYNEDRRALVPEGRESRPDEATQAKVQELTEKAQAAYRLFLTPEQQVIYDKNIALIKERLEQRRKQKVEG
jgi:hypothetical protein